MVKNATFQTVQLRLQTDAKDHVIGCCTYILHVSFSIAFADFNKTIYAFREIVAESNLFSLPSFWTASHSDALNHERSVRCLQHFFVMGVSLWRECGSCGLLAFWKKKIILLEFLLQFSTSLTRFNDKHITKVYHSGRIPLWNVQEIHKIYSFILISFSVANNTGSITSSLLVESQVLQHNPHGLLEIIWKFLVNRKFANDCTGKNEIAQNESQLEMIFITNSIIIVVMHQICRILVTHLLFLFTRIKGYGIATMK